MTDEERDPDPSTSGGQITKEKKGANAPTPPILTTFGLCRLLVLFKVKNHPGG